MPPITPKEAEERSHKDIPEGVFEAWNVVIAKHYKNGYSSFLLPELVKALTDAGYTRSDIDENGWLDLEPYYRKAGWTVNTDVPGFNESYETQFEFKRKR